MRVSMSEIGSTIKLPARFCDARDQAGQRGFAKRQTRTAELAQVAVAAATHRAAIHHPCRACVPRQLRQTRVILLRFQLGAQRGVLFHRRGFALVSFKPCLFGHTYFASANGIPIIFNNSSASSSVSAEVTIVM